MTKPSVRVTRSLLFLGFLASWEVVGRSGIVHRVIITPFSEVILELMRDHQILLLNLGLTLYEIAVAYAMGSLLGLGIGFLLGGRIFLGNVFEPLIAAFFTIPVTVFYPLMVIWLGPDVPSKFVYGGLITFFPILLNTMAGVRGVDRNLVRMGLSIGLNPGRIFTKIVFPYSLPTMMTGLRFGFAMAVVGVLVGEILVSIQGIGRLMDRYSAILLTNEYFAALVMIMVVTVALNHMLFLVEKKVGKWRR